MSLHMSICHIVGNHKPLRCSNVQVNEISEQPEELSSTLSSHDIMSEHFLDKTVGGGGWWGSSQHMMHKPRMQSHEKDRGGNTWRLEGDRRNT